MRLCAEPSGKHPLATPLAGWNTLEVLGGHKRVVYKATVVNGIGLLEALCLGPRSANEVYDMAVGLVDAGLLEPDEITDMWDALAVLDVVAEKVGLDGWDYQPPPAPEGMVRAAVAAGLLTEQVARLALEAGAGSGDGRRLGNTRPRPTRCARGRPGGSQIPRPPSTDTRRGADSPVTEDGALRS